jgi:hypothetical protein
MSLQRGVFFTDFGKKHTCFIFSLYCFAYELICFLMTTFQEKIFFVGEYSFITLDNLLRIEGYKKLIMEQKMRNLNFEERP